MRRPGRTDSGPARRSALTNPLNIRLPTELRERLRRFAASRQVTEASAIRSMLKEHLEELPLRDEIERARRWQVEQVWDDARLAVAGVGAEGSWRDILTSHRRTISDASAGRERARRRRTAG